MAPGIIQNVLGARDDRDRHRDAEPIDDSAAIFDIPSHRPATPKSKRSIFGRGAPIPEFKATSSRRGTGSQSPVVGHTKVLTAYDEPRAALTDENEPYRRPSGSSSLDVARRASTTERREVTFTEAAPTSPMPRTLRAPESELGEAIAIPIRQSSRPSKQPTRIMEVLDTERPRPQDRQDPPASGAPPAASLPVTQTVSRTSATSSEATSFGQSRSAAASRPESIASSQTTNSGSLPALQQKNLEEDDHQLDPLAEEELDPGSFDLVAPVEPGSKQYSLETRSELLFSRAHLEVIFDDPTLLVRFTSFLSIHRKASVPVLAYYLDCIKALKAISYANAITASLGPVTGFDFTHQQVQESANASLEEKARLAFDAMVREDLPAYVTHTYIQTVSTSISRKIMGTLPAHLRQTSEGLAEVFCLTDPSRPDNPIVFASEEFHRTTQYGMNYVIGRNCRFLQGPKTNPNSVRRLREMVTAGAEHCEAFLNYRRDGSPFMNLLMCAPLCDSRGVIRYYIGAQVDVSGLVKDCIDFESLQRLVVATEDAEQKRSAAEEATAEQKTISPVREFRDLSEMLSTDELDTVRRHGGRMHRTSEVDNTQTETTAVNWNKPRVLISDHSPDGSMSNQLVKMSGRLGGIYENYLLVRPYPSLRILFASPALRVPGILQSKFMTKIGGSQRVHDELTNALADGRGVTAKVRWVSKHDTEGRSRWIHCTPLFGINGAIGVWMIVLVDEETALAKSYRQAPPMDPQIGRSHSPVQRAQATMVSQHGIGGAGGSGANGKASMDIRKESADSRRPSSPGAESTGDSVYTMRI